MSGVITAAAVTTLLTKPKAPAAPPAPLPPPQAAQAPDEQARRASLAVARAAMGPRAAGGTLLTGTGGVSPGALNLGRSTLLGQ